MNTQRIFATLLVAGSLAASAAIAADVPGGDFSRLSSQYAGWAGGKSNADNLIGGDVELASGSSRQLAGMIVPRG